MDNGVCGSAIAFGAALRAIVNVGEGLHRLHEQLAGRFLVQVAHPQGTGVNQIVAPVVGKLLRLVGATEQQSPRGAVLQYVAQKVERCPAPRRFHHLAQAIKFIETEEKALARGSAFY